MLRGSQGEVFPLNILKNSEYPRLLLLRLDKKNWNCRVVSSKKPSKDSLAIINFAKLNKELFIFKS